MNSMYNTIEEIFFTTLLCPIPSHYPNHFFLLIYLAFLFYSPIFCSIGDLLYACVIYCNQQNLFVLAFFKVNYEGSRISKIHRPLLVPQGLSLPWTSKSITCFTFSLTAKPFCAAIFLTPVIIHDRLGNK